MNVSTSVAAALAETSYFDDLIESDEPLYRRNAKIFGNVAWGLAAAVGIPGNLLVLSAILFFRDMRQISNVYIFNLALADLLFLAGTPIVIIQSITREWIFGQIMCKLFISGNGVSQFASAVFIGVLSLDRYLAVCEPVSSTKWRSVRAALIISMVAWLIVTLEMLPLLVLTKVVQIRAGPDDPGKCSCMLFWGNDNQDLINITIPEHYNISEYERFLNEQVEEFDQARVFSRRFFTTYVFALSYLLPLVAIWYFYAKIIGRLWRRRTQFWNRRSSNNTTKRTTTKVTIMGLAIVISYTLCWLPFWCVQWAIETEADWTKDHKVLLTVSYAAYALQYVHAAANPFLYVFLTDTFRQNVYRLIGPKKPLEKTYSQRIKSGDETMSMLTPPPITYRESSSGHYDDDF